jgi:hypothetical protein
MQNEIKEKLENIKVMFSNLAIECVLSFFQVQCTPKSPFQILERLPGEFEHNIFLGNGNDTFQAVLAVGLSDKDAKGFVEFQGEEDLLDIFGELANVYCGMLMDQNDFTSYFGILTQAVPQYTAKQVFYPKAFACAGELMNKNGDVFSIGYAIRKLNFMQFT